MLAGASIFIAPLFQRYHSRAEYESDPLVWQYGNRAGSGQAMMDAMGTATKNMHHIKVKMLVQHGREDMVSCLWGGGGGVSRISPNLI